MLQTSINPFPDLGSQYTAGLNYIITNIPGSPTVDDLVTQVVNYVQGIGYFSGYLTGTVLELKEVAYTAINNYTNNEFCNGYDKGQKFFIDKMKVPSLIDDTAVDELSAYIANIEDKIIKSILSTRSQRPLLLATMIGQTGYNYWTTQIGLGGGSAWNTPYFASAQTSALANIPFWLSAGMEGVVIGSRLPSIGSVNPAIDNSSVEIVSALIAALTLSAGIVIFQWVQEVQIITEDRQIFNSRVDTNNCSQLILTTKGDTIYVERKNVPNDVSINSSVYNLTSMSTEDLFKGRRDQKEGQKIWFIPFGNHPVFLEEENWCYSLVCICWEQDTIDDCTVRTEPTSDGKDRIYCDGTTCPHCQGTLFVYKCPTGGGGGIYSTFKFPGGGIFVEGNRVILNSQAQSNRLTPASKLPKIFKSRIGNQNVQISLEVKNDTAYYMRDEIYSNEKKLGFYYNITSLKSLKDKIPLGKTIWFIPFENSSAAVVGGGNTPPQPTCWCSDPGDLNGQTKGQCEVLEYDLIDADTGKKIIVYDCASTGDCNFCDFSGAVSIVPNTPIPKIYNGGGILIEVGNVVRLESNAVESQVLTINSGH